jgi:hypothetical protein
MQPQYGALAADKLSLDNSQCQPAVPKTGGDGFSGDTTTETHDVEFMAQLHDLHDTRSSGV